jgi:uncharacterized protein DUF3810
VVCAVALVLMAACGALLPLPAASIERLYSTGFYLRWQNILTPLTNAVPIALFDLTVAALLAFIIFWFVVRTRRLGFLRAFRRSIGPALTITAVIYLVFLAFWGLNYRRVPLEQKIDFDDTRVTTEAMRTLGATAVRMLNAGYESAHALEQSGPTLEDAFAAAQRTLGSERFATPGVLKRSVLELYFRQAAIDGMTDPWFLEVIVNPDTLPFERPFVILHEWGHLAGYAHEAEANFLAWVACLQGNALAKYSGWLAIYEHVAATLASADRKAIATQLDPGPRQDLIAAAARYARSSPVVRTAARDVYDSYLRANRVDEGIASYTGVVRLILGAGIEDGRPPRLRRLN